MSLLNPNENLAFIGRQIWKKFMWKFHDSFEMRFQMVFQPRLGFWLYNPVFECIWKTLLHCYIIYKSMGSWTTTVDHVTLVLRRCSTFFFCISNTLGKSTGNTLGKILRFEQFGSNIIGVILNRSNKQKISSYRLCTVISKFIFTLSSTFPGQ